MQCSLCGQEWEFRRIFCAYCGEDKEQKLPVYVADQFPYIRVEACETCHRYLKSIDLSVDGHAIPEVDDLVSVGLDLWAAEQGFARVEPGLAGV